MSDKPQSKLVRDLLLLGPVICYESLERNLLNAENSELLEYIQYVQGVDAELAKKILRQRGVHVPKNPEKEDD